MKIVLRFCYENCAARNYLILIDSKFLPLMVNKLPTVQADAINAKPKTARSIDMKFRFRNLYETPNFCSCDTRTVTSQGKRETCK